MIRSFCNRCEQPAETTSTTFDNEDTIQLEVIARSKSDAGSVHICDDCMAKLLVAAANTFPSATVVKEQNETAVLAAEHEDLLEEVASLKSEKAKLQQRSAAAEASVKEHVAQIESLTEQLQVQIKIAQKARTDADATVRKTIAELRQRAEDEKNDPEYIERSNRRERMRSAG